MVIVSTAFVGSTAFMLGVDCYSLAGVKEVRPSIFCSLNHPPTHSTPLQFYIWNLGFNDVFQRFEELGIEFPVTQTMEIELGLLGAVAIMGIALQLRILKILQRKLSEIRAEQRRIDKEQEERAAERFASLEEEKAEWEREHPALLMHGRQDSTLSSTALLKDNETAVGSPLSANGDEKLGSTPSLSASPRPRYQSGVSTLMASTPVEGRQSPGALPALDLGFDLESDVPKNYLTSDLGKAQNRNRNSSGAISLLQDLEDLRKKEELLNEIQNIRKSIEVLKSESPAPSSGADDSRRPSFSSRRTLSHDLGSFPSAGPSHLRPVDSRSRTHSTHSMDLLNNRESIANVIGRSTSVPLQNTDEEWEAYIRERKLLQPPSGVSPPIPTSPVALASPKPRLAVPTAVSEALMHRQRRESSLSFGRLSPAGSPESMAHLPSARDVAEKRHSATREQRPSGELPPALRPAPQHKKSDSHGGGGYAPGVVLPRNRNGSSPLPQSKAESTRRMSPEELDARHREQIRQMQSPLTQAEKEHADVEAARSRWERARQLEKQAVTKRQAEQAALVSKKEKEEKEKEKKRASGVVGEAGRHSISLNDDLPRSSSRRQARASSQDVLLGAERQPQQSSKRLSMMKVEDWQKHQQAGDVERGGPTRPRVSSSSRRLSAGVPFPADASPARTSRESRRLSGMMMMMPQQQTPRDPPS